jgi:hypothetical protein
MLGDRVVWTAKRNLYPRDAERVIGSSGKVRDQRGRRVYVDWGGGSDGIYTLGYDVISCKAAAKRGIEPWTGMLPSAPS